MKSTPTLEAIRKKVPRRLLGRAVCWPPMMARYHDMRAVARLKRQVT